MGDENNIEVFGLYNLPEDVFNKVHAVMLEDVSDLANIFKVLADPLRLHILKALEVQELCVCVFITMTDYKYSALSYHLKMLKDANLVGSRRDKNFQMYFLTDFGRLFLESIRKEFQT
ncbi:MAG: winged helix-turn-helix transcriptional regulator [Methanosarcinaceae archaeon]|nr:winged helix-turn-helix transcriptional regulator [Methanosarcinaceae archaeon]